MSERLAMPDGRPITIWSGGNLEIARQPLRKEGVPYKLVSKHLLRGASVASVVDDMPADEFFDTYGITYGSYHQV
jgi:hypothetical protein